MAIRTIQGVVTSASSDKTITVSVATRETHPLYGKKYTKTRKYTAHDESNSANVGDTVIIRATKPISKTKFFELTEVIERSQGSVEVKEEEVLAETKEATS